MDGLATVATYRLDSLCGVPPIASSLEIATLSYCDVVTKSDSIVFGGMSIPPTLVFVLIFIGTFRIK